jgi:response regulator RpfG family c-di-GMP phosphodiesterase
VEAARNEIAAWSGRQFDPMVVALFLNISPAVWEDLHRQVDTLEDHFNYSEHLSNRTGQPEGLISQEQADGK